MANLFTLDEKGVVLAVLFGIAILFFGQNYGLFFLVDIIGFLALSAIVTEVGRKKKEGIGTYEHARGWKNVVSNGMVPVAVSAIFYANGLLGSPVAPSLIAVAYIASVAAVTADKFSSEIGVLDNEPTMLMTLKKVKKGVSGGVTLLGLGASLLGALIISSSALYVSGSMALVGVLTLCGFFGSIVDSILGYYEEEGIGNKYTSNFACSLAGVALSAVFLVM